MKARSYREKEVAPFGEKRGAILRAALEVFAEHGVNGVAVPEIAARARVGTGTIYRYFESKEALVNELYRAEKEALGLRLQSNLDLRSKPQAFFNELWENLITFAREEPNAYRFLELQDHLPYLDTVSRDVEHQVLGPIHARVKALQKSGVFRRDLRPEVIMALVWGAFVNLFKAERGGYLTLEPADLVAAREACWRMCTVGPA
jgi:AcrR family transcriptional regulator